MTSSLSRSFIFGTGRAGSREARLQLTYTVRVIRIPAHIESPDHPFPEVRRAFEKGLGKIYSVDAIDWGGWVSLSYCKRGRHWCST